MKFKVGDRVKSKVFGEGTVVEVETGSSRKSILVQFDNTDKRLHDGNDVSKKRHKENRCYFYTNPENELEPIKPKTFTKSDLQDGDIVTQRDGRHKKVCGKNLEGIYEYTRLSIENYTEDLLDKDGDTDFDIIKVERPPKNEEIVYERKEEILDKSEKEYLGNVIRPFRHEIRGITKEKACGKCYISINMIVDSDIDFPVFEITEMYKNMEAGKMYTLEELGL